MNCPSSTFAATEKPTGIMKVIRPSVRMIVYAEMMIGLK
jgi:hypothetical protein